MLLWNDHLVILLFYLHVSSVQSLDCNDPSVVIECIYNPDSGQSCGLRLEQSLRLYNVVGSEVVKIHEWLDESVIHEEVDAVKDLRWYLNEILKKGNASYDSVAYVLYICRFRPFSCARASRFRRGYRMNDTNGTGISKMRAVQEVMRARWALICHRMVLLERQSLPRHAFWRNESTGAFHCSLQSLVPWKYAMEILSQNLDSTGGITKYENNLTVCRASIYARSCDEIFTVRCVVRYRTGVVRTIYLWGYNHLNGGWNTSYLFETFLVVCVVVYLVMLIYNNVWSSSTSERRSKCVVS